VHVFDRQQRGAGYKAAEQLDRGFLEPFLPELLAELLDLPRRWQLQIEHEPEEWEPRLELGRLCCDLSPQ
jgi:hypothetical protein